MKKILVISDLHCGHMVGLTPPDWWRPERTYEGKVQRALWGAYVDMLRDVGRVDCLVVNGDAIDGRGKKSGGTEQIEPDRLEQVAMAEQCIAVTKAPSVRLTYGTAYHVSEDGEDIESVLAKNVGAVDIGSHTWLDAEGVVIDCRHHCGSSGIPHGRGTQPARERLWNVLWSDKGQCPRAQVIIRSHVHYHSYVGGSDWVAMTTPALQGLGSKYGARRCSGTVDFGMVLINCKQGDFSWVAHTRNVVAQHRSAAKI
jgi:hypothetical protein